MTMAPTTTKMMTTGLTTSMARSTTRMVTTDPARKLRRAEVARLPGCDLDADHRRGHIVVATASLAEDSVQQIDGLVHTFILPACTDLPQEPQRETYDAHGLTLEYPGGFCLEDGPIPGRATPSDASGIVQLRANTEPFELVLVLWHALEGGEDATDFLEAYLAGLAETGVEVTPGNSGESQQDGHAMALRYAELKIETAPVPSLTGAWICPESGRAFAATYLTAAGATPEDLLAGFQRYLAGLDCH